MNKVFTHENRMIVYNMRNLLQGEGIETIVRNEFAGVCKKVPADQDVVTPVGQIYTQCPHLLAVIISDNGGCYENEQFSDFILFSRISEQIAQIGNL